MEPQATYRALIKALLTNYVALTQRHPIEGVETLVAFDDEHAHYFWLTVGWSNQRRVYGITVHIRLIHDTIWIEQDWTEDGIATDLIRAGVPPEAIVFAFREPIPLPSVVAAPSSYTIKPSHA